MTSPKKAIEGWEDGYPTEIRGDFYLTIFGKQRIVQPISLFLGG
ncbi:MAG: hypothetical protein ACM65L_19055 [Microcoleus sp.]